MQEKKQTERMHAFLGFCKAHSLKITPQRVAVYRELLNLNAHPSADVVHKKVRKEHQNISFDTVNRTLLTFAEIGIVDVVETFGGARRFDPNVTMHHHLHCVQCGKVFDFYSRAYENLDVPESVLEQFQVISKRVVLKGICKDCRK